MCELSFEEINKEIIKNEELLDRANKGLNSMGHIPVKFKGYTITKEYAEKELEKLYALKKSKTQ